MRLIVYLALLGLTGYLCITNVPTYFAMQNFKHDIAELARGAGAAGLPVEKVRRQAHELAQKYEVPTSDVTVTKTGPNLAIVINTTRKLNFIVTDYDWQITQRSTGQFY